MQADPDKLSRGAILAVIVAALGYFVDVYDLIIFSIVRISSLKSIGVPPESLVDTGAYILNMQLVGLLVGGVIWGVLGDKKGRIGILFGSILIYSIANLANAYVQTVGGYAFWRFIAGFGLAGEIGAGITLVSELMPQRHRGYATALVVTFGVAGCLAAAVLGELFHWRTAYLLGGVMGIALLLLRVSVHESGMFEAVRHGEIERGNFISLFTSRSRFLRYLSCIAVGLPIWLGVGVLVSFSPEIAAALGVTDTVKVSTVTFITTAFCVCGDFVSGFMSQWFRTRKKVIVGFLVLNAVSTAALLLAPIHSYAVFLTIYSVIGFSIGYWAVLVTTAAEQFGTNLRATVTTTVPNFVRASAVPMTSSFVAMRGSVGIPLTIAIIAAVAVLGSMAALYFLEETYSRDLNFVENDGDSSDALRQAA